MKALEEERNNLKHDLNNTHLAKDELIKKVSSFLTFCRKNYNQHHYYYYSWLLC